MKRKKSKLIVKNLKLAIRIVAYVIVLCLACYGLWNLIPAPVKNVLILVSQYKELNKRYQEVERLQKMLKAQVEYWPETGVDIYGRPVQFIPPVAPNTTPKLLSAGSDRTFNTKDDLIISEIKSIAKESAEMTLLKYYQKHEYNWAVNWVIKKYGDHLYTLMYKYWEVNPFVIISNVPSGDKNIADITITLLIGKDGEYGRCDLTKENVLEIINATGGQISIMPKFNIDKILQIKTTDYIDCHLKINYTYGKQKKSAEFTHRVIIHPLDDFTWDIPEMLACFVMSTSSDVLRFANTAVKPFEDEIANRKIRKVGLLFHIIKATGIQNKKEFLFSSCAKAIDVDPILAVIPDEKRVLAGVVVEKISGITIETNRVVTEIREVLKKVPVINFAVKILPKPKVATYSSKLSTCYTENNWLIVDLNCGSFLDACKNGLEQYNNFFHSKKLFPVEVIKAWAQGYLPPDISLNLNLRVPSKEMIEKSAGKDLREIFDL